MTTSVPQFTIETPLSTITVPGAMITVSIRTPDGRTVNCALHAEKVIDTLQTIESNMKIVRNDRYSTAAHNKMKQSIVATIREHKVDDFSPTAAGVACAALWCILNDPRERAEWRKKLGTLLQSTKNAFVGMDLRADGRYVYAIDGKPLLIEEMERATTEAEQMTAAAAEAAAKKFN